MKHLFPIVAMVALGCVIGGCSGGTLGGGSRLLITREVDGNQDVYLLSSTGATLQRLTSDAQEDEAPRWSPDGFRIAFIRRNASSGAQTLYMMNGDGNGQQNLTSGVLAAADVPFNPAWLNDDTLVFRRGVGAPAALAKRSIAGGDFTTLTTPGTNVDDLVAVSPDGAKIAFVRASGSGTDISGALYVANADGANPQSISTGVGRSAPAWSPDGTKLAFVRITDSNMEIYVAAADGSNPQRLTNNAAADFAPIWSPDGNRLIFASNRDGNNELYRMNSDGGGLLRLTNNTVSDIPYGWK